MYTHIMSVGDLLADGHAGILPTDTKGTLRYYAGTGKATTPYAARQSAATGRLSWMPGGWALSITAG